MYIIRCSSLSTNAVSLENKRNKWIIITTVLVCSITRRIH